VILPGDELMVGCEENRVDYLFGLAKNDRLIAKIKSELTKARLDLADDGAPVPRSGGGWRIRESIPMGRSINSERPFANAGNVVPRLGSIDLVRYAFSGQPYVPRARL
jgi:hypothetical protein